MNAQVTIGLFLVCDLSRACDGLTIKNGYGDPHGDEDRERISLFVSFRTVREAVTTFTRMKIRTLFQGQVG